MQVVLATSVYIEVVPGVIVSPGSVVMFTATLFAVLLVYIHEDMIEARKLIYGLVMAISVSRWCRSLRDCICKVRQC